MKNNVKLLISLSLLVLLLIPFHLIKAQTSSEITLINNYYQENFILATEKNINLFSDSLISNQIKQQQLRKYVNMYSSNETFPTKVEFEKEVDYQIRVTKFNKKISYRDKYTIFLKNAKSQEDFINKIIDNFKKYKSKLYQPQPSLDKLNIIGLYDSEIEFFTVNYKGEKFRVYIPISEAQLFKSCFEEIVIYKFSDGFNRLVFNKNIYILNDIIEKLVGDESGAYYNNIPCIIVCYYEWLYERYKKPFNNSLDKLLNKYPGSFIIYVINDISSEKELIKFLDFSNSPAAYFIPRGYKSTDGIPSATIGTGNGFEARMESELKEILSK